jgi:DNA ligase-1
MFKPMLATDADLQRLKFPLLASYKLDGVRAVVRDGQVYSRSNKLIPNRYIQAKFSALEHYDGELIYGQPNAADCYTQTVSAVMTHDGLSGRDVDFYVFDHVEHLFDPYTARSARLSDETSSGAMVLPQFKVRSLEDLLILEEGVLEAGYEGLILRDMTAPYKCGRSSVREGYLLKLKRFMDAEAEVIGYDELLHNANEATINELGRTKRSSHQAGKVPTGTLGALQARTPAGVCFGIGTGFTAAQRAELWTQRANLIGRMVKYKYLAVGVKDAPRHPVFLGWRHNVDM